MLRGQQLVLLAEVLQSALQLVDAIGKVIIFTLDYHVEVLFLKRLLLESVVPHPIRLILLHHHIVVAFQKFDHLVLLNSLSDVLGICAACTTA